jgi:nitroreductase
VITTSHSTPQPPATTEESAQPRHIRATKRAVVKALSRVPEDRADEIYLSIRRVYRLPTRGATTIGNSLLDLKRYLRYSFVLSEPVTPEQMRYFLRMRYHTFEKGLAMPEPRPGFGQAALEALLRVVRRYEATVGCDELLATVVNVLSEYREFNATNGVYLDHLDRLLDELREKYPEIASVSTGGTLLLTTEQIKAATDFDFETFVRTRCSVRNFRNEPVDRAAIERAVRAGQKAPSVCNRQAARVHVFDEPDAVQHALSFQGGHRGFGHTVPCVMIITADLQAYYKPGERFQGWIDGGLFTMSLMYGLHAERLGSCCLNWNVTRKDDLPMRRALGIPDNEVVITMLAVGPLPDELRVAESPRRPLDEVLIRHER